jgi:RecG-like helicase
VTILNKKLKASLISSIVIFSMIFMSGCGNSQDKNLGDIEKYISSKVSLSKMEKGTSKTLKRYYGLNSNELEDFILYTPKSTMDVDEMLMVKVKDEGQIQSIEDVIDSRVNKQLESFSGYGPKQCELLDNYEIKVKGKYIFFAVSEKAQEMKDAFKESR